jgi:hypothetical protein
MDVVVESWKGAVPMRRFVTKFGVAIVMCLALSAPVAADGATVQRIEDFGTSVAVRFEDDFPIASIMRADCAFVERVERPDGSATETLSCVLSDEPVMVPEFQGLRPTRAVSYGDVPCLWKSDYWGLTADIEVYADDFDAVVTPGGQVHVTSSYPAEPLVCG